MNSNVLIAYHDSNKALTYQIGDFLISNGIEIYLISDQGILSYLNSIKYNFIVSYNISFVNKVPEKISERTKLVQNNGILLVIADRNFQKSNKCMEILHFARDLKKEIFGMNIYFRILLHHSVLWVI